MSESLSTAGRIALLLIRWWLGLTYMLGGLGCVLATPVWLATGNWGGVDLVGGGVFLALIGWLIHPWGLQRTLSRRRARAQMTVAQ
jgi:hypothetical protein